MTDIHLLIAIHTDRDPIGPKFGRCPELGNSQVHLILITTKSSSYLSDLDAYVPLIFPVRC